MKVIEAVTSMLETYLYHTESTGNTCTATYFHTNRPPKISIKLYLKRLEEYMKCSEETFILALIYLDRITSKEKQLEINSYCIHRLFLSGLVVAAKFFEDKYYKNSYYSKVGGISNIELNTLELQFLLLIDFQLYVSDEEYEKYQHTLMQFFGSPILEQNNK
jgi:Cyclin